MNRVVCHQSPSGWCPNSAACTRRCGGGPEIEPQQNRWKPPTNPFDYGHPYIKRYGENDEPA